MAYAVKATTRPDAMTVLVGRKLDGWLINSDGFVSRLSPPNWAGCEFRESLVIVLHDDGYDSMVLGSMITAKPSSMAVVM